jgi:hypothetical protein
LSDIEHLASRIVSTSSISCALSEHDAALGRPRYEGGKKAALEGTPGMTGHRHGSRPRSLTGSFGSIEIAVPRAGLNTADGKTT